MKKLHILTATLIASLTFTSCMSAYIKSVGGNTTPILERTYLADFNIAWQAALEALKNNRLDVSNRDGGYIQTQWLDNTAERNFVDPFGDSASYLKAQLRLKISFEKGKFKGKPSVRIKVVKEQLVQQDVLEGWRLIETDTVEEKTLLYRIGRIILIMNKITQAEDERAKKEIENTHF